MALPSSIDQMLNNVHTGFKDGIMRSNRFTIDMYSPHSGNKNNVPAFAVRIPGWDIGTVVETGVMSSIKYMPFRKNWNQGLFISFYMTKNNRNSIYNFLNQWCNSMVQPDGPLNPYNDLFDSRLEVTVGDNPNLKWIFEECYPRVLYPIELKPVEDFAPFIYSVQFSYRYFDNEVNGSLIG